MVLQYAIIAFLYISLMRIERDKGLYILINCILIWSTFESIWGILQVLGFYRSSSLHSLVILGSFGNPGPYGALIATGVAMSVAFFFRLHGKETTVSERITYYLSIITMVFGAIALPASRSRAAWFGLFIALLSFFSRETKLWHWLGKHRCFTAIAVVAILFAGGGVFLMKKDSAIGRFHIWNMECRVIASQPYTGVGFDKIFKAYGDIQSAYFQKTKRAVSIIRAAGSPTYAYNEYLKIGMAWGIGGLLLSIIVAVFVVWRLFQKKSVLSYGALVYAIFAFASFPLSVIQLKLLGSLFLAESLIFEKQNRAGWFLAMHGIPCILCLLAGMFVYPREKERRKAELIWRQSTYLQQEAYELSIAQLKPLYPQLKDNYKYLFDYGYAQHKASLYEESNAILQQGAELSCDPIFHIIMAKNYFALGHFDTAEQELLTAHWLIPSRIYPLLLLMELYDDTGQTIDAINIGKQIKGMSVYERNPNMVTLYCKSMSLLNKLEEGK